MASNKPASRKAGPSKVGIKTAFISLLLCPILVVTNWGGLLGNEALAGWSAAISIVILLLWMLIGAPVVMRTAKLEFWADTEHYFFITSGWYGACIWFGFSLFFGSGADYPILGWWLGLIMASFTAIILGKIANHWGFGQLWMAGHLLGFGIWVVNLWAMQTGGPLATSALAELTAPQIWGWTAICGLICALIGAIDTAQRQEDKLETEQKRAKALEQELTSVKGG